MRCSAVPSVLIVWIESAEAARFRKNHSVVVSSLDVVLVSGDLFLPALGFCFQRRLLPVAYSDSWYSGSGLDHSNIAIASSKA